jgi:hypothetical protein
MQSSVPNIKFKDNFFFFHTLTYKGMRTTKTLSKAYTALQEEVMEKIKSFFKGKPYVRIVIDARQHLKIETGTSFAVVNEIHSNGDIIATVGKQTIIWEAKHNEFLPVDALLTILDELERMKKTHQLKKP